MKQPHTWILGSYFNRAEPFIRLLLIPVVLLLLCTTSCKWETRGGVNYGIFAPDDAWLEGDSYPYYGSENEWSRRMFEKSPADRFYKRRGQRQMLAIIDGEPAKAVEYCEQRLREDPNDAEQYYMLCLAYCELASKEVDEAGEKAEGDGKVEEWLMKAEEAMGKAVELGMTFGRFVAGPRQIIVPLTGRIPYQKLFKKYMDETAGLVHGPMLGQISGNSASCWVRTAKESTVQMIAWEASISPQPISSPEVQSTEKYDYTAVVEIGGLTPMTTYIYNIVIDGEYVFDQESMPRFATGRVSGEPGKFRVAFGGGAGYNPEAEKIWTSIQDRNPDALLLLGDNVYVDLPEMPGAFHDYTYYRRYSRPEYRSLISHVPVYSIWDDHDAGIDDIWMGPYVDMPEWKVPMVKHYQQNWVNPGYGTHEWPGCWYSFQRGEIEFFMLDGRTYRTCPFGAEPTMLGPVQKKWFLEGLSASTAKVKVLVSPVPWNFKAKPGSHDTWAGFEVERAEIFEMIRDEGIEGVVLMSADRHRSEVWELEWDGPYPIYEFLSSRLTNMHFHDTVPGAIYSYNDPQAFGILNFDTSPEVPEVLYEIVNLHGEKVYEEKFQIGVSTGINQYP